ncbi:VWA domain-containing protein [Meiothermus sp. CFH 77666]|uniref:VWA domain-containing protein n=1 Tax=Meiothermus sp. CFH 77666 TaxID=2817942 RepID=UPI001AA03C44|nr:VWA domain-containing protein [Meiothermus sp. CFH 77666]
MQVAFGLPWLLLLLPPVLGLVWWWYRRRRPPERKVAGLWLWQKALRKGRARRRFDARLFLLLLSALLAVLALSAPQVSLNRPGELVVVLDVSASMAATDVSPSRLERAKELAREHLGASPRAVLVVAGSQIRTFGPAPGRSLVGNLEGLRATAIDADLEAAIARGKSLLPGARVLTLSDQPAPPGTDGYLNVAGNGPNVGITAIGPGFVAVANAGPGLWRGEVLVDGRRYPLEVPARGFSSLEVPSATPTARIVGSDALALDNEARFSRRLVRVEVSGRSPALERLLALLGTSRGSPSEIAFEIGTPRREPTRFTVFLADQASGQASVFDVERTLPYLRGAELVGYSLRVPPRPQAPGWQPLAVSETGQALAWYHPNGLYLPPAESLQNLPAFPVLLYNLIAPRGELRSGLLTPAETLLPRPSPDQPLPPSLTVPLAPWLALLAALVLAAEFYFFQYRTTSERLESRPAPTA